MKHHYQEDPWKIIEEGLDASYVEASESIFSLGNGAMGQRANFEEHYSGDSFQGSYIGGVYYPDKTKVGWWKNGYPEYFAKVLNAPDWISIDVFINNEALDLNNCEVRHFKRVLDMKRGVYERSFEAVLPNGIAVKVEVIRFLCLERTSLGVIKYALTPLNQDVTVRFCPKVDGDIHNKDSNWDDPFWKHTRSTLSDTFGCLESHTLKTAFEVATFMCATLEGTAPVGSKTAEQISMQLEQRLTSGNTATLIKYGGYVNGMQHPKQDLTAVAKTVCEEAVAVGFDALLQEQETAWEQIWEMADIEIYGDVKAQQAIRFNIFQLNQTYNGKDARLNIGPKGFTGEKYGGSTYWDTEAYCLPFYMATKDHEVARNLLKYRYDQLDKAIENAQKLGFDKGAALYPMVTMNGEECHNEWEITFEEIHRNGAIAYAIYNYERFTDDATCLPEMGLEVLIGIARFWKQRIHFSSEKNKYVLLGVTGPNEYENNVHNNWYTNYMAQWCLQYAATQVLRVQREMPEAFQRICKKTKLKQEEAGHWNTIATQIYFPYDPQHKVYLQQDGFLDKDLSVSAAELPETERPINQHWSWDRILRSPYIKQADVLQGFYFFEEDFSLEELERHYNFYEPYTVHESSLSPCVHAILAAKLDKMDDAYRFYLQTSRLDLDDYNKEVAEGLHITSMAGTWMTIVEGFGGMRIREGKLSFAPKLPSQWEGFRFKINFRGNVLSVAISQNSCDFEWNGLSAIEAFINGTLQTITPSSVGNPSNT